MMRADKMPRELRLRRVMICCCAVIRNVAYYKSGWSESGPLFAGNIERTISGNFMDVAVLEWCKMFGEPRHEPQHWQRVISSIEKRQEFMRGLLAALDQQKSDWRSARKHCLSYRNDFAAHLGSEPTMNIPTLDPVWKSAAFYYDFLRESEMPSAQPSDILEFYQECTQDGRAYYRRFVEH